MKTMRETEPVDALGAAVMVAPARHAGQVRETPHSVCRWPTMAIRDLTMVAADAALAADPLFHLGPGGVGHLARGGVDLDLVIDQRVEHELSR